jgi:hypothetical protein
MYVIMTRRLNCWGAPADGGDIVPGEHFGTWRGAAERCQELAEQAAAALGGMSQAEPVPTGGWRVRGYGCVDPRSWVPQRWPASEPADVQDLLRMLGVVAAAVSGHPITAHDRAWLRATYDEIIRAIAAEARPELVEAVDAILAAAGHSAAALRA